MSISTIRATLVKSGFTVSPIQNTEGNYNDNGKLIETPIPTVTTNLCEIGNTEDQLYLTIIVQSSSATLKGLRLLIQRYPQVKIYGFHKFLENYYPSKNCQRKKYEYIFEKINGETLFQIHLGVSNSIKIEEFIKLYSGMEDLCEKCKFKYIDQLDTKWIEWVESLKNKSAC